MYNVHFRPQADATVAKYAMLQHQSRVMISLDDGDCYQRIHVRRSHLVMDTMKAVSKATFDVSKILKVVFVGEPCVDEGGPCREFFQLALKEIFAHSGLFSGSAQCGNCCKQSVLCNWKIDNYMLGTGWSAT